NRPSSLVEMRDLIPHLFRAIDHRPELVHPEPATVKAGSLLSEDDRPGRGKPDEQPDDHEERHSHYHEHDSADDVYDPLGCENALPRQRGRESIERQIEQLLHKWVRLG